MSKKRKPKIGDTVSFTFAGTTEAGEILKIEETGKNLIYTIYDGKYTYPVREESIHN